MAHHIVNIAQVEAPVLSILERERSMALSPREWKHRLAAYGYSIREVGGRQVVTSLVNGTDLGILPNNFA